MYSNSMHNNMMRRSNNTVRTVAIVVAAGLFLYGLYAYHDLHTRHKRSVEKADRLRQQHDSLSAQLQVVYEQKSRLDKLLQQEKADHKQTKDELAAEKRRIEQKYLAEKQELLNRIRSISSEHKMLQSQHEDLQNTFSKLHDQLLQLEDDCKKATEQHSQEFSQMKQEKDNEMAQLKDEVANLQRRNVDLQTKLHAAIQQNQISQGAKYLGIISKVSKTQAYNNQALLLGSPIRSALRPRAQENGLLYKLYNKELKGNLVANLAQDQKEKDLKQQQQQQPQQNQQLQMHQQESNAAVVDIGKQQLDDSFPFHGNQILDSAAKQPQQPMVDKQPLQQEAHLQGQGDLRKPYFDPKEAKPDHEVIVHDVVEEQHADDGNAGVVNAQQVLAPNINQRQEKAKNDDRIQTGHLPKLRNDNRGSPAAAASPVLKKKTDGIIVATSNDKVHATAKDGVGRDKSKPGAVKGPVVAPDGALGVEQAKVAVDRVQQIMAPQRMAVIEPSKKENMKAPDGRVNVDKVDVANIVRGRSLIVKGKAVQPGQGAFSNQDLLYLMIAVVAVICHDAIFVLKLGVEVKKEYMEKKEHNVQDPDYRKLNEGRADDDNWRNIHEPIKEEDKVADNVEDKHFDEDGFNRINQLDHGGAPLLGPNFGQGGEPIQGPILNMDGMEAVHRQGQIVGPDVLNVQADRIEAPIGQRQDQLQASSARW
ncbi:hypothetical protein LSH36_166g03025 [Paralvinella palmiformis]|uniref:Golgi integral membrane protein 4 n=1 Tax=Paralvinella palmiformis TaxID=53620 RepID=A0AAD9JT39_9ANNE|nr:hypothetical protein LSH36_166g03025 [Paralvinella palmiformis]